MDLVKTNVSNWIKIISVILGILIFSLCEIALNDIEKNIYKIKTYDQLLSEIQSKIEKEEIVKNNTLIDSLKSNLNEYEYQINSLETDIASKKQTLDQLLENQKVNPDNETKIQITLYQKQFIDLQNKKDLIKTKKIDGDYQLSNFEREKDLLNKNIENKYKVQIDEINTKNEKQQQIKILITQSILIIILFLIGTFFIIKFRKSDFIFPVFGFNIAVYIVIIQAIYTHSPLKLHYYVFVSIGIVICIIAIIWLLRNITKISKKQTTNLIKKNLALNKCPKCNSEISLKEILIKNYKGQKLKTFIIISIIIGALIGNGSGIIIFINNLSNITAKDIILSLVLTLFPWLVLYFFLNILSPFKNIRIPDPEQFNNKTCPVCGLVHIIKCDNCGSYKHNLLPYCNNCGIYKIVDEI